MAIEYIEYIGLFVFGLAIGSFINVLSIRYDPNRAIFKRTSLMGRSRCVNCEKTLHWYELIPLVSFLIQFGKCRSCKKILSLQYPFVELSTGLLFAAIPYKLASLYIFDVRFGPQISWWFIALVSIFLLASATLVCIAAIDARLKIIPNQANLLVALLGSMVVAIHACNGLGDISFLEYYSGLFGFTEPVILRYIVGAIFGICFFGAIVFFTRGKGMGMGDVKLAGALGLLFGWPDIALISFFSFILGSIFGILVLIRGTKTMRSAVPFGPFIVAGAILVLFWGKLIVQWYFMLFPL